MPKFINKSWPLLLMPIWWILWILGFIFHNCYFRFRNEYRKVKPEQRNAQEKKRSGKMSTKPDEHELFPESKEGSK